MVPGAPALSCSKPLFVVGFGFALVCVFVFGFVFFVCVVVRSFVRSCCMSLRVHVFWLCVLFFVVVVLCLRLCDVRRLPYRF